MAIRRIIECIEIIALFMAILIVGYLYLIGWIARGIYKITITYFNGKKTISGIFY